MKYSEPKVLVLLSTYNGALYLQEQIDSILKQDDIHTCIYKRRWFSRRNRRCTQKICK